REDLRPGCVDPRHVRSLLAGPGGARYTTLVSKHSETSDATDSHPGDAARTPPMSSGPSLVLRDHRPQGTRVRIAPGVTVGGPAFVVMAGPCAVESADQIGAAAGLVAAAGCPVLRGGAFKPRTSPYSFQGLGAQGVRLLLDAAGEQGMAVVTEVLEPADLPAFDGVALLQVGARNMQNFALLKALGQLRRPVLLKRGLAATVDEWLLAAEYLLAGGNDQVILCERGVRGFEPSTRNMLDLSAVVIAKQRTHLPVMVDPSHATGRRELVVPLSLAAAAAGADGLLVEVHPRPDEALSDGPQALLPDDLHELMARLPPVFDAVGRSLAGPPQRLRRASRSGLALPFADRSFDIASIAFGIRNVDDPVRCLRELGRVARTVVVLEFGQPSGPFGALFRAYSRGVMPLVGGLLTGNRAAYEYLPRT